MERHDKRARETHQTINERHHCMPMDELFAKYGEGVNDRINEFAAVSFDLLAAGPLVSPPYSPSMKCLTYSLWPKRYYLALNHCSQLLPDLAYPSSIPQRRPQTLRDSMTPGRKPSLKQVFLWASQLVVWHSLLQ
jgi:hypothetical protein